MKVNLTHFLDELFESNSTFKNALKRFYPINANLEITGICEFNLFLSEELSQLSTNKSNEKDFERVLLIDDLSDTGLTLNKSIEWLKNYGPTKNFIKEVKTACLWKKKSSSFEPDFCPVKLENDPWIVQPTEHYEELTIEDIIKRNNQG